MRQFFAWLLLPPRRLGRRPSRRARLAPRTCSTFRSHVRLGLSVRSVAPGHPARPSRSRWWARRLFGCLARPSRSRASHAHSPPRPPGSCRPHSPPAAPSRPPLPPLACPRARLLPPSRSPAAPSLPAVLPPARPRSPAVLPLAAAITLARRTLAGLLASCLARPLREPSACPSAPARAAPFRCPTLWAGCLTLAAICRFTWGGTLPRISLLGVKGDSRAYPAEESRRNLWMLP